MECYLGEFSTGNEKRELSGFSDIERDSGKGEKSPEKAYLPSGS
jgi:hypothetical protein